MSDRIPRLNFRQEMSRRRLQSGGLGVLSRIEALCAEVEAAEPAGDEAVDEAD